MKPEVPLKQQRGPEVTHILEGSEDVGNNEDMAADRKVQKRKNVMSQQREEMTDEKEESSTCQSREALWGGRRCWECLR